MINNEWHPASEKPKKYGKYLTVFEFAKGEEKYIDLLRYGEYNDGDFDNHIDWYDFDWELGCVGYGDLVLYWMELPEIPKGEKE